MADSDVDRKQNSKNDEGDAPVAELLYKQNAELAIRNKTLSLLRKLYQFSVLALEPEVIADKITDAIQKDLSYELVSIMIFDEGANELRPLKFAKSDRLSESLKSAGGAEPETLVIKSAAENEVLGIVVKGKLMTNTATLSGVFKGVISEDAVREMEKEANIKTSLIYPLIIEDRTKGVLIMSINHDYSSLSKFEIESIESFVNVIAVALDRAFIYKELKEANEKLKELDRLKSEFLSFASHQVKSPMGVIKGFAEIIRDGTYGEVPEKVKETANKIFVSADKLVDLVNNLLDMRKIEEGKMNYAFEEADLVKMTNEVVDELRSSAEGKGLSLTIDSKLKEAIVKVDPQKFRQVILNFVDNAIKYTEKGWVKVSIYGDGRQRGNVILRVSDSGYGISSDLLPNLFKQFSRDAKVAKTIRGTGLGLFIAKQIIKDHSGEIWVESEGEGKGSAFYILMKRIK